MYFKPWPFKKLVTINIYGMQKEILTLHTPFRAQAIVDNEWIF